MSAMADSLNRASLPGDGFEAYLPPCRTASTIRLRQIANEWLCTAHREVPDYYNKTMVFSHLNSNGSQQRIPSYMALCISPILARPATKREWFVEIENPYRRCSHYT